MFPAPHALVDGLPWEEAGPGPDPSVILDSALGVNGTRFRMLAFRVPMPFSAGWSASAAWEDDKGLHGNGLLWNPAAYRATVREVDAAAAAGEMPMLDPVGKDGAMLRAESSWREAAARLGWPGLDWRPSTIRGNPYLVLGWPEGQCGDGAPSIRVRASAGRTWFGRGPREHRFNLLVEGGPCVLDCAEVRALGGADGAPEVRGLDEAGSKWLASASAVLDALPQASSRCAFDLDGRPAAGILCPANAEEWCFDSDAFLAAAAPGLAEGRARWALDLPLLGLDAGTAAMLEGAAEAVRSRRVSNLSGGACIASTVSGLPGLLGIEAPGDPESLRTALFARLGKVTMRGLCLDGKGAFRISSSRAVERAYVFGDAAYIGLSPAFSRLAEACGPGDMLALAGGRSLVDAPMGDLSRHPAWVEDAPRVADGRIRALLSDLAR